MISGAHSIIFSTNPEADRQFFRDVLKLTHVDVGDGWLIFGLPPAEVAFHPADTNSVHEFYLMCDSADAFIGQMQQLGIACGSIQDMGWGRLTEVALPGGGKLGVYEPRHARPESMGPAAPAAKTAPKGGKKPKKKKSKPAGRKPPKHAAAKGKKSAARPTAKRAAKKKAKRAGKKAAAKSKKRR